MAKTRTHYINKGIDWFYGEIKKAAADVNHRAFKPASDPFIGGMFAFLYSAKHADKLPYWDRLPLVIPFTILPDGFIGLNLHYASGSNREKLLKFLLRIRTKKSKREYVSISYKALQIAMKTEVFEPCVHRYLSSHIQSRLVKISLDEWENVAALPLAQWQQR